MLEILRRGNWTDRLYRYQWQFVALVVVIAAYLCYLILLQPVWLRYQTVSADLVKHQAELNEANGTFASAREANRVWHKLGQQFGKEYLTTQTADTRDLAVLTFFNSVQTIARVSGVVLQDINQIPEAQASAADDKAVTTIEHKLAIHVVGNYDQISDFIGRLAANSRTARVDSTVLTGGEHTTGENLDMQLNVSILFFVPEAPVSPSPAP